MLAWCPLPTNWVKLNVDGGMCNKGGLIYTGGVIRDANSCWLGGYSLNRGMGNVLDAEFWGLFEGLSYAWKAGFRNVLIESDFKSLVELLGKDEISNHPLLSIILRCKKMMNNDWNCHVRHVYRECNRLANDMAYLGHKMDLGKLEFKDPPDEVLKTLQEDYNGLVVPR
ncbi:hypothetical protein ACOSQ4_010164 [Xanthoceras sorbifolium]